MRYYLVFDEKKKAINLLKDSSVYHKSPRKSFIIISKYYKHIGLTKERTKDLLLDWLKNQRCNIEFSEVIFDLESVVNTVYEKNYIFLHDISVDFYENEVNFINNLDSKGEKNIGLSLLYLSKLFGNNFYCYHKMLHKMTGLSIRHIKRLVRKLEENNLIEIIKNEERTFIYNDKNEIVKVYSLPNVYKIKIIGSGNVVFSCGDIENINDINKILK